MIVKDKPLVASHESVSLMCTRGVGNLSSVTRRAGRGAEDPVNAFSQTAYDSSPTRSIFSDRPAVSISKRKFPR
jgi:hypothetical protein